MASRSTGRSDRQLYSILPTPFSLSFAVDYEALRDHVIRLSEAGIPDLLLTGAYGEFQSLTDSERCDIVASVASVASGAIMACAALPSTLATAGLANRLLEAGAHQIMISPPLIAEVTETEILRHFEVLSSRIEAPLVVYNNPVFGVDLGRALLARIAELSQIKTIKQGSPAADGIRVAIETFGAQERQVLAASDLKSVDSLKQGADGFTSTKLFSIPTCVQAHPGNGRDSPTRPSGKSSEGVRSLCGNCSSAWSTQDCKSGNGPSRIRGIGTSPTSVRST